jgi:hypothetical protein
VKALKFTIISIFIMVSQQISTKPGGWQGIIPLHSNIEDVERVLGPGSEKPNKSVRNYKTPSENILINYSEGPCVGATNWNVPLNTVINIRIYPMPPGSVKITDLKIDKSKFKKEDDSHLPGNYYLINDEEGITVYISKNHRTSEDEVDGFNYGPAARDKDFRCK